MENENSPKGLSPMIIGGIVVVVVVLAAGAYFMTQKGSINSTTTQQEQSVPTGAMEQSTTEPQSEDATEGKKVTLEVSGGPSFKFSPAALSVNEGDTVTIKFVNSGGIHDFVIDEYNVKTKQLANGASEEVTFVASKKGTFEYYCSVGNHRQMGMKGTLTVN